MTGAPAQAQCQMRGKDKIVRALREGRGSFHRETKEGSLEEAPPEWASKEREDLIKNARGGRGKDTVNTRLLLRATSTMREESL